jgi:predicted Zn-ribbon and HTH transcriptional regulator
MNSTEQNQSTEKTKLSVRIKGQKNFYLNITPDTDIEICSPDGFILFGVKSIGKNIVGVIDYGSHEGWTLKTKDKRITNLILGTDEAENFIKGESMNPTTGNTTQKEAEKLLFEAAKKQNRTVFVTVFCKECAMYFKVDKVFYHNVRRCPFCGNTRVNIAGK